MAMTPRLRKFALTVHVTTSVGLLGSISAFLALATTGLNSHDTQIVRAAYLAMNLITQFVIVPLAFASLLTGLIQSLGTPWGLFRHYWVLVKLLLTAFATAILLAKLNIIGYAAHLAAETILQRTELSAVGMELRFHAVAGLLVLLVPAALSLYKPRGLTPYGRRRQQEQKGVLQQPNIPRQQRSPAPRGVFGVSGGGVITITLRRMQVIGLAAVILIVHFLVLHATGGEHLNH